MPGLAGIFSLAGRQDQLTAMVKMMMHERFYDSGTHRFDPLPFAAGWVTHQSTIARFAPVWNPSKDVCLIIFGEDFLGGAATKDTNDQITSKTGLTLLERYELLGESCLAEVNGWFSGLIVDFRERKVIVFIDRYGLGRLYYHQTSEAFYFASEAKCLLKILPGLRQLDSQSLAEQWSCGCVLQNRSLFRDIHLLPAGSAWTISADGRISKKNYFRPETWESQSPLSAADYSRELQATFQAILPKYVKSAEQVALSLTGGLDSRMILAWAPVGPFKLNCYTFGGMYRECADVRLGRRVAKTAQQYHQVISLHQNFFQDFPALAKRSIYFTDGAMDVTGAVELSVNRSAREIAPVRLTGNYGDEILRRNIAFAPARTNGIVHSDFASLVARAADTYHAERNGRDLSFVVSRQLPWHHFGRFALERTQVVPRSPYLDNDLVALAFRAPDEAARDCTCALEVINAGDPLLGAIPTDRGDLYGSLPVLNFFRKAYQKLTTKAEYAYDYGMPDWLSRLDRRMPRGTERLFLGRHKFYHFRVWYRDGLSRYVKDVLLDPRTSSRSYLNGSRIESMVQEHLSGKANHTTDITRMLTTELIQRNLIDMK